MAGAQSKSPTWNPRNDESISKKKDEYYNHIYFGSDVSREWKTASGVSRGTMRAHEKLCEDQGVRGGDPSNGRGRSTPVSLVTKGPRSQGECLEGGGLSDQSPLQTREKRRGGGVKDGQVFSKGMC